ncbi:hypothetical protein ABBQ32_000809 [Trebouxia sp. C0010 RCD-2024]
MLSLTAETPDTCVFGLQTWVEGVPVKGKSAKPAKPSKAAALQLLQQLASQHNQSACPDGIPAGAVVESSITASACLGEDAEPAASTQSFSSEPEVSDGSQLRQSQPQLPQAFDMALSSIESDSEAEVSPEGRIASDEEDDRQGPEVLANSVKAPAEDAERQGAAMKSSYTADLQAEEASHAALASDGAAAAMLETTAFLGRTADNKQLYQPTLTEVMLNQRRRMSRFGHQKSSLPDILLALTLAQQQHCKEGDGNICSASTMPGTAECSSMSTHVDTGAADVAAADHHRMCAQLDEHSSSQTVLKRDPADEVGPSGRGLGDFQLWQNLAEALQDKQACQKLAQLTVTLLARM